MGYVELNFFDNIHVCYRQSGRMAGGEIVKLFEALLCFASHNCDRQYKLHKSLLRLKNFYNKSGIFFNKKDREQFE